MTRPKIGDRVVLSDDPELPEQWKNSRGVLLRVDLAHHEDETVGFEVTIRKLDEDTEISVTRPCFRMI